MRKLLTTVELAYRVEESGTLVWSLNEQPLADDLKMRATAAEWRR